MNVYELEIKDGIDEENDNKIVMAETVKFIDEMKKKISDNLFNTITEDIEKWMHKRYENVKRIYFNNIIDVLLGRNEYNGNHKLVKEWLVGLGYDSQSLRKKIYEENKETILKAIFDDAMYETLSSVKSNMYFDHWYFKYITTNYPQSEIVKYFIQMLMAKKDFPEYMNQVLDKAILDKKVVLDGLTKQLGDVMEKIKNIENN